MARKVVIGHVLGSVSVLDTLSVTQTAGVWLGMVGLGSNDFESTWEGSFVGFELGPLSWCLFGGSDGGHKYPNQDTRSEASCSVDRDFAHVRYVLLFHVGSREKCIRCLLWVLRVGVEWVVGNAR
jgi:hypothetical protein